LIEAGSFAFVILDYINILGINGAMSNRAMAYLGEADWNLAAVVGDFDVEFA
jgi:hypothetical protein